MNAKPLIAVTMGDPAGIGPELCVRMLSAERLRDICRLAVVGSAAVLEKAARAAGLNMPDVPVYGEDGLTDGLDAAACVVDTGIEVENLVPGQCRASCGRAAFSYIETAIRAAIDKRVAAIATGPINKKSLHMAGYRFPGHTEILAQMTGTKHYCMMLTSDVLSVSFVTTHLGHGEVIAAITPARVCEVIELTADALARIRKRPVRLGVCGLNPHAGEQGLFGLEEIERIIPGIEAARGRGIDVSGPFPPDTVFTDQVRGRFDGWVCQYHDQGHIPFKMLAFERGVNVTLGLPIVRTSVDHGTAFDIAWKGIAGAESLNSAVLLAVDLCGR